MSLLEAPPPDSRRSAEPAGKPEPFWQGFVGSWKRLIGTRWFWVPLLLVELIVPIFYRQGAVPYNIYIAVLGLGALLALVSLAVICYAGLQRVQYLLGLPQEYSRLLDQHCELERSIPKLIDAGRAATATQLLALASLPDSAHQIPITGISEQHGTVHLLLELPATPETFMGIRLTVSTRAEHTLWGVVEVTRVDDNIGYAAPVDRVNPDFWDHLEERMRRDPSPPRDIVVKTEMYEVLAQLKRALRYGEVTNNE